MIVYACMCRAMSQNYTKDRMEIRLRWPSLISYLVDTHILIHYFPRCLESKWWSVCLLVHVHLGIVCFLGRRHGSRKYWKTFPYYNTLGILKKGSSTTTVDTPESHNQNGSQVSVRVCQSLVSWKQVACISAISAFTKLLRVLANRFLVVFQRTNLNLIKDSLVASTKPQIGLWTIPSAKGVGLLQPSSPFKKW